MPPRCHMRNAKVFMFWKDFCAIRGWDKIIYVKIPIGEDDYHMKTKDVCQIKFLTYACRSIRKYHLNIVFAIFLFLIISFPYSYLKYVKCQTNYFYLHWLCFSYAFFDFSTYMWRPLFSFDHIRDNMFSSISKPPCSFVKCFFDQSNNW